MNIFNETVLIILKNVISHETVLCYEIGPPWFSNKIKLLIGEKNVLFKRFRSDRRNNYLRSQLCCLQNCLNVSIKASK